MSARRWLALHPIFGSARPERLELLAASAEVKEVAAGKHLIRPGAPVNGVWVLAQGVVALTRQNREKRTRMLLGMVEAPGLLGDAELHSGATHWEVSARAVEPVTAVHIPGADFLRWLAATPEACLALYQDAAARLMLSQEVAQVLALQKLENQILRLLFTASTPVPGFPELREAPLRPTHLAHALGVNVRSVARHLCGLEEEGVIRRTKGRVVLSGSPERYFAGKLERRPIAVKWRLPVRPAPKAKRLGTAPYEAPAGGRAFCGLSQRLADPAATPGEVPGQSG